MGREWGKRGKKRGKGINKDYDRMKKTGEGWGRGEDRRQEEREKGEQKMTTAVEGEKHKNRRPTKSKLFEILCVYDKLTRQPRFK